MIRALGFSQNLFSARNPGRLCRGRERWIEPWEIDEEPAEIHRLVITGATFSDDSAADALRGLHHSGIDLTTLLTTLFPRRDLLAFMEDGHPADIPEAAEAVEMYSGHRAGGRSEQLMVRWFKNVSGVRELREVLGDSQLFDPESDRVRGFALRDEEGPIDDVLTERFFLLVGMSSLDSPPARYQPAALADVLEICRAVVLLHRDKHGTSVGIYSREPLKPEAKLEALCEKHDALLVRFAIPPMLARWDRALAELRTNWIATRSDPFPVPVSTTPSYWEPRHRRRRRDDLSQEARETSFAFPPLEPDEEDPGEE
jgi:hypothetical protein